jgi:hypothetical protein
MLFVTARSSFTLAYYFLKFDAERSSGSGLQEKCSCVNDSLKDFTAIHFAVCQTDV